MRWLHLSDFHVGKDDYAQIKMFSYITEHVGRLVSEGKHVDLLFITGDLANKGHDSEYETFWLEFVEPLQAAIGPHITKATFVVPGNHDVDRDMYPAFSREEMSSAASHYFDPTEQGRRLRELLVPRFRAFVENDQTIKRSALLRAEGAFSMALEIENRRIGVVGINTAWLCKDNHDERKLTPGKALLENALNSLVDVEAKFVLAHHPIDWFLTTEQKPIKSLLGKHAVLYLHGHLHDSWAEPTYGGGTQFLSIQSGAAFQARETEIWRNGFVWGELNLDIHEVRLQPRKWDANQQMWIVANEAFHESHRNGDWWVYPLPGTMGAKHSLRSTVQSVKIHAPEGWSIVTVDELKNYLKPLDPTEAINYFNGAVPNWHIALSTSIPRRSIVNRMAMRSKAIDIGALPLVTLLLSSGCEGKTTALLQAAFEIAKTSAEWHIIKRGQPSSQLEIMQMLPILSNGYDWLLVVDDCDDIAGQLLRLCAALPTVSRHRVHILLACRDADWKSSQASKIDWGAVTTFCIERLEGVDEQDAKALVEAWTLFGDAGLGDLVRIPPEKRAAAFHRAAHNESKHAEGALFGALLSVRHGSDLAQHCREMLSRLNTRSIPGGGTLKDALAFVAIMHSEGLNFLSRPVLAEVLCCPYEKLHREVIVQLGKEAAATTTSAFVFTRHKRVADVIAFVLEHDFAEDLSEYFLELTEAALRASIQGYLPGGRNYWMFTFATHFYNKGDVALAIKISEIIYNNQPKEISRMTNLARLYRSGGEARKAVTLFKQREISGDWDRRVWMEWALAESVTRNDLGSAMLNYYSLSDQCDLRRLTFHIAARGLYSLVKTLANLHKAYREPSFKGAETAAAILALKFTRDVATKVDMQKHISPKEGAVMELWEAEIAVAELRGAISVLHQIDASITKHSIPTDGLELSFNGLELLAKLASQPQDGSGPNHEESVGEIADQITKEESIDLDTDMHC